MVAVSESTDKLRQERDRFVGFAFANADALIEIDQSLKMSHAAGAVQWLSGEPPDALIGWPLLDLVAPKNRPIIRALLSDPGAPERFGPVSVQLRQPSGKTQAVTLSGTPARAAPHLPCPQRAQACAACRDRGAGGP